MLEIIENYTLLKNCCIKRCIERFDLKGSFILLFCFYSLLSFSQKKKEYFYDEDFNRVSREVFSFKKSNKYFLPK